MRKTCGGCAYSRAIYEQMTAIYCEKRGIYCGVHDEACEQYKLWLTEDMERENNIHPCKGCENYIEPDGCKSEGGCAPKWISVMEYDEDTDEYYMPEGWWGDFVTHWMPLPEPPYER